MYSALVAYILITIDIYLTHVINIIITVMTNVSSSSSISGSGMKYNVCAGRVKNYLDSTILYFPSGNNNSNFNTTIILVHKSIVSSLMFYAQTTSTVISGRHVSIKRHYIECVAGYFTIDMNFHCKSREDKMSQRV